MSPQRDGPRRQIVASVTISCLLLLACASGAGASGHGSAQQITFGANVELVLIDVAVLGDGDVPVTGLTENDFVVEEDGEARDVALVMSASDAPLDVALVMDMSGSMAATSWRERATVFLALLDGARDCVYLMGFSSGVGASLWTRPHDQGLVESLRISEAHGATALFDATVFAANELAAAGGRDLSGMLAAWQEDDDAALANRPPRPIRAGGCPVPLDLTAALDPMRRRRRMLVVVTDGDDSGSRYRARHARLAALAAGVPVFQVEIGVSRYRAVGQPAVAMSGPRNFPSSRSNPFDDVVADSGGRRIPAGADAYKELLEQMRGFYVLGYYAPRGAPGAAAEIRRHEIRLRLRDADGELLYPRASYRPTVDHLQVEAEIGAAQRALGENDLEAALLAADKAVAADPLSGPAHAARADVLEAAGLPGDAAASAMAAAALTPGEPETHFLAARLAFAAGRFDDAWEQAIRADQAGADSAAVVELFDRLAHSGSGGPEDLLARLEAPRVALVVGPSLDNDVFARAALGKAMRAVGNALVAAPQIALSRRREGAAFVVRVSDESVEEEPPRRFRGRIAVTSAGGEEVYDEDFELDELDDPAHNARDLSDHVKEIVKRIADSGSGSGR